MDERWKGYAALAVATYLAMGPIAAIIAESGEGSGRIRNAEGQEAFKSAVGAQLILPAIALWYGISKLQSA